MKKKPFIIGAIAIGTIGLLFVLDIALAPVAGLQFRNGKIYSRADKYQYVEPGMATCMAIMLECGVCYDDGKQGFVENKICYLPIF